jgi:hypothetical protein
MPERDAYTYHPVFGNLAILTGFPVVDPWLCVAGFDRVCLFELLYYCYR